MQDAKKTIYFLALLLALTGCSEFALLMSGTSIAVTQNAYAKAYNGANVLTIMGTEKDIKTHVYEKSKDLYEEGR